jgi:hypothetical protein
LRTDLALRVRFFSLGERERETERETEREVRRERGRGKDREQYQRRPQRLMKMAGLGRGQLAMGSAAEGAEEIELDEGMVWSVVWER